METNSSGDTSTEPKEFGNFCIRQYVAEIRRKDWKKCCPFNLSGDSPESNYQAERVFASLILEDNDDLINTPENTQAPNSLTYSEVRNPEGQAAISETHTGVVIRNDATSIINDTPLESASCKVNYAHCEIEKVISGDMVAAENDKPEDVVTVDDSLNDINDGASKSSSRKLKDDVQYQNEKSISEDIIAAGNDKYIVVDATRIINDTPLDSASCKVTYAHCEIEKVISGDMVAAENDKLEDVVVVDDSLNDINDGASKSSSRKLKDDVQYQNEKSISQDIIASGNDKYIVVDDDGANTISDEERNLAGEKPQKFRLLSEILKELQGPCDAVSAGYGDPEFSSESEDDSDDFTLETFVRKKKGVRINSKSGVESKKKKRSCKVRQRSFGRPKRMKPVPADSSRKDPDPELGSKRQLRKTRTDEVDLPVMNKHKKSSAEIIVRGSTSGSQKVAPSSRGAGENRSETEKDSLISRGNKRSRETIQDDCGRDVLKFLDGSQRRFTEENTSRSTHGVKSAPLVQPTIGILNSIETDSGCVQTSIRENSPPIDNESMAALQLLRLFNSGVTTQTSSKTATKDPAASVSNGEISRGIDEKVPPASGSIVGQSCEEFNVINAGLPQAEKVESGTSVCVMNVNPSEFSILNAKKYMRRVKVIQK